MEKAYARLSEIETEIVKALENIRVIDCHEHLPTERQRLAEPVSALKMFSHYCRGDLLAAGMPQEQLARFMDEGQPFGERWELFKPYYRCIRNTAYTRCAHISLKKFYGEDELTDDNVEKINAAMVAANRPGLYRKVLADACGIEVALTQSMPYDAPAEELLAKVVWIPGKISKRSVMTDAYGRFADVPITSLERLETAAANFVDAVADNGAVGVKLWAMPTELPDPGDVSDIFDTLMSDSGKTINENNPLMVRIIDVIADRCAERGLVVCFHTGYWGDFRALDPSNLLPFVTRHHQTKFDVYHVGYPYVREAIMLGKAQPNVWLDMCWTYIISQKFAGDALEEMLEMVPRNKILGFGGDFRVVEKVYGHLIMARETIARSLAKKIAGGYMSFDGAIETADMMLRANPKALYSLR